MKNYYLAAFAGLMTVTVSVAASAQNAPNIVGKYSATIIINRLPQPVFVDVRNLKPGDEDALRISYSLPRNCGIVAAYGGYVEGVHVFYGHDGRTGFCEANSSSVLKLRMNEDRQLMYELVNGSDVVESGLLNAN